MIKLKFLAKNISVCYNFHTLDSPCYLVFLYIRLGTGCIERRYFMKHVKTLNEKTLKESLKRGGCGECQTSCQSACKTSCTVGNQGCENPDR